MNITVSHAFKHRNTVSQIMLVIFMFLVNSQKTSAQSASPIWQFQVKNGRLANCQLQFAHMAKDNTGQPLLVADSRSDKTEWHSCIMLPQGLLKKGKDYVVTVDYEIVDCSAKDSYFYVFVRSNSLGMGADQWQMWHGQPGATGIAKLRIAATAGDFGITAGIHNQGAIRIRNLRVLAGDGWTHIPLTSVSGGTEPLPAAPTGAKPFTVEAPVNPNGPVLNLADFGAVADGDAPPSTGPDRNFNAFKAAIAKCRAVKASKLIVNKGVYRITSGQTIRFDSLSDFIFDGGGATFLYHQIKGGAGMSVSNCNRTIMRNFNMDWDWKIDPLASVGRVTRVSPDGSFFEMRFETVAPLDPKRWITLNPLDEKLRVPGAGQEFGKLSLQYVTIYSFPGIGFITGGDQHHFELLHCRITFPDNERRPITTTADGFHVSQSQGFIKLEDCDFGYMGDDCINIHDNIHSGVRRVDEHTLILTNIIAWMCPYTMGDKIEIRNGDYSPTGFTGQLTSAKADYKNKQVTLVFEQALPAHIPSDAILFNRRYGSHNCIIQNCYFHENRARGVLCNSADWLIEGNRFYHNQHAAMLLAPDVSPGWSEGFGAQNVIIRNNRFEDVNPLGASDGSVIALGATVGGSTTAYPILQNILVENNIFKETNGPIIEAASFKNLVIRNNTTINLQKQPASTKMRGAIRAGLGSALWVEANNWTTLQGIAAPGLFYDPTTAKDIICNGNRLNN